MALVRSLKKIGTTHEIVILVPTSKHEELLNKISDYGILKFDGVKVIDSCDIELPSDLSEQNHYWTNTFFKLKAFSLEQFKKIVLIDSDMLVQRNIDCLFDKPHMSAVIAGQCMYPDYDSLNSGLMVVVPVSKLYNRLLNSVCPTVKLREQEGNACGDQDVIHYVFPDWFAMKECILHEKYNVFWGMEESFCSKYSLTLDDIAVLHFIGQYKPWNYEHLTWQKLFLSGVKRKSKFIVKRSLLLKKYISMTRSN